MNVNKIQELIEAGKKATEGNFRADCKTDTGSGYSITATDVHYCRAGVAHYISEKDAKFFTQAANARTDIETLYTLAQEMAEALEAAKERIIDAKATARGKDTVMIDIEATLTKWAEFKK